MLMNSATLRFVPLDLDKRRIGPTSYKWIRIDPTDGRARGQNSHAAISIKWNLLCVCLPDGEHWTAARGRRLVFSQDSQKRGFGDVYKYKCRFSPSVYIPSFCPPLCRIHAYLHYVHSPSNRCTVSTRNILLTCMYVCIYLYRAPFSHYLVMWVSKRGMRQRIVGHAMNC